MLKIRIIPCLDVADGRVVKGVNFVNLKDAGDPVEAAYRYDQAGADEICFLDINATYKNRNTTYDMVKKTAEKCFIPLTVGGGVRTVEDVRKLLLAGADKVSFNSAAVANPEIITAAANQFGSQCIVCAIDAKTVDSQKWELFTHGGRQETGIDAIEFAKKIADMGAGEILLTSMDKDGTKSGFDNELLGKVSEFIKIPVIASGGVGTLDHFYDGVVKGKADALLAASVFHFNEISIKEVKKYLKNKNINIRD